jgi:hypothetical protein
MNLHRRPTLAAAGALAVATGLYLVAALVTVGPEGRQLRPLYEGIGPSAPYRWVSPPSAFKASNVAPVAVSESIDLTSSGTPEEPAGSGDGQLVLTLPAGAIPPSSGHTSVVISVAPVDPGKLGPLPPGLYSDGNAYKVTAEYLPGRVSIPMAAQPVDAVLRTPVTSAELLTSPDGKTWSRIPDQHIPNQAAVSTSFTAFGYLLAAANVPLVTNPSSSGAGLLLVVGLGIAAVLLLAAALIWRSDRRRRAA